MEIREYCEQTDKAGLYRCFECLQDFERAYIPSMPKGADICDAYISDVQRRCKQYSGTILVATDDTCVIGYVSVFAKMVSDEIDDSNEEFAQVGDLFILDEYQGRGYGKQLLAAAEDYARCAGSTKIRIGVLSDNKLAHNLYLSMTYKPLSIELEKDL